MWDREVDHRATTITIMGERSIDLLGRKILADKGVAWADYKMQLQQMISQAQASGFAENLCDSVAEHLQGLDDITSQLIQRATPDLISSVAVEFMNYFGAVSISAMWLKLVSCLPENSDKDPFVEQQLALARFFIEYHGRRTPSYFYYVFLNRCLMFW